MNNNSNIERFNTMKKFNMNNIEGMDASIEESLFCYGLAWILSDDKTEYKFYYGVHADSDGNFDLFDVGFLNADTDVRREFDNLISDDFKAVSEFSGLTIEEFLTQDLPFIIFTLLQYYGYPNVFGDCYSQYKYLSNINRFQSM